MEVRVALLMLLFLMNGCSSGQTFTNLGNGVGISSESIDAYAKAHGVTRAEAKQRMAAELKPRRQTPDLK